MRTHLRPESKEKHSDPQHFNMSRAERPESARRTTPSWPDQHAAANGHSLSGIRILPERSDTSATPLVSLADPPEKAPPAPAPPNQQAAPAIKPPVLESGEIEIEDAGNAFTGTESAIPGFSRHDVGSGFTVKTKNMKVLEDSPGSFVFGLVQNVLFDHFEATYTKGDMLVDSVGPLLDIWPSHPAPFFHEGGGDNPVYPTSLFTQLSVGAKYTDEPSWPLPAIARFCDETVLLKSATRSMMFRVGVVARHVGTGQLFQLGAAAKTHFLKWQADIKPSGRTLKSDNQLKGTYTLDKPGVTLKLANPNGVDEINKLKKAAVEDMETRCENLL